MCALEGKKKTKNKRGEGNDAKSPHSASDRRRQHPDSFEVEGGGGGLWGWKKKGKNEKRGREIVMEEGDEKVEREHHLPGIRTELRESQSDNPLCFHI